MIFASLKDLGATGNLIKCCDSFEAQSFEEFPHQILAHQPNQSEGIWHFDVILPDVVSREAISNDKQASNENVRDNKQASNKQDKNKKKDEKKGKQR